MKKKLVIAALTAVFALGLIFPSFKAANPSDTISICSIGWDVLDEF